MYAIICLINWTAINKADTKYNRLLLQGANRVYSSVLQLLGTTKGKNNEYQN